MKRNLSLLLAAILILSAMAVLLSLPAAADGATETVYLSDNGNDENSGKSETAPVQTFGRAQEVLGNAGGVILIPDVYTYPASGTFYMPYQKGASYVFRGTKADGSSRFVHGRNNITMNNPLTFDNLIYATAGANYSLAAHWCKLVFTESVTMAPYNNDASNRSNYPYLIGGDWGKSGQIGQNTDITLNGGTFNYVLLGCISGGEMYGDAAIRVGGSAKILNRIYCGGSGMSDMYGDISVAVSGGEVADYIFLGGINTEGTTSAYVTGNVSVKITGGTVKGISCLGTYDGPVTGNILLDLTEYEPATAEWAETKIIRKTEKTAVYLYGETIPVPAEQETEPPETASQEPASATDAPQTEAQTPATAEAPSEEASAHDERESKKKSGCGSVAGSGVWIVAMLGMGVFAVRKKKAE